MSEPDAARAAKLRADVSRIDPGLVHDQDLRRIRETVWRQPVRLAVLHHPVSPLPASPPTPSPCGASTARAPAG